MESDGYRNLLISEYNRRRLKNPSYSIRAFARDLDVSSTSLSDVLASKRHFSKVNARRIGERLGLSPRQMHSLFQEILGKETEALAPSPCLELEEDSFRLIANWYYFVILNLARIQRNQAKPEWIARRLGIPLVLAKAAVITLKRLGYLEERNGRMIRTALPIRTTRDVPSAALRRHHRQNLERAAEALDHVPVEKREISSVTLAFDSSRMTEAKEQIAAFKKKFLKEMDTPDPDEAYTLAIQFFPPVPRPKERK